MIGRAVMLGAVVLTAPLAWYWAAVGGDDTGRQLVLSIPAIIVLATGGAALGALVATRRAGRAPDPAHDGEDPVSLPRLLGLTAASAPILLGVYAFLTDATPGLPLVFDVVVPLLAAAPSAAGIATVFATGDGPAAPEA